MTAPATLSDALEEYDFLEGDDRYRMLIELGEALEPMPEALKTDQTLVPGCSSSVWVYPTDQNGKLSFLADSNSALTKGIIALVLLTIRGREPSEVAMLDIADELKPFNLTKQLTSKRTQGIPNMIALIRETAGRYSG
ncbi:SufE family protein [Sphingomonas montana]|uniref:SufE family protein n=1 Tax=Sphingomonas montana TaxID=1843236 RepID=UPI00096C596B|nr:SufE family protein [Sphingomonas montana]